jgi:hypothetical protein
MYGYRAHGLSIASWIELPAFDRVELEAPPDLTIRSASVVEGQVLDDRELECEVVADASFAGAERILRVVRLRDGALNVEASGITLETDPSASTLTVGTDRSPEAASAMPWLVGGLGIATALLVREALVMHASMFVFEGRGHLVMAPSGHGKSLVTAAACAAGASLVAEDTVRVECSSDGDHWRAFAGSTVLRTRRTVDELAPQFDPTALSASSDGRTLVRLDRHVDLAVVDYLHLIALDRETATPVIDHVDVSSALIACLSHLRVPGIVAGPALDLHFDLVGRLTTRLPLDLVRLPWQSDFGDLVDCVATWLASANGSATL